MKEERERKRETLLQLTEAALAKVAEACKRPRKPLEGKAEIGLKAGAVLSRFKMGKYFKVRVGDYSLGVCRNQELIDQEAALDGIYVVRTSVPKAVLSDEDAVLTYKRLAKVERAFKTLKSIDLQVRPIYHHLEQRVPAFIHISDGKMHDVRILDTMPIEPGAFYVMDRGYVDFERLFAMKQCGAFYVTRAKQNMDARRVRSLPCDKATGVSSDQLLLLNGYATSHKYPDAIRRIRFRDSETAKVLVFLTNNTTLPASTICTLYKKRWTVELFFKWIKQHLRIKKFMGNSENAVKTQIWCAVATYTLIAIIKKDLKLEASLYTLLQVLSVSAFERIELPCAFAKDDPRIDSGWICKPLPLFDI
jgi:IS4 transposase